MRLAPAQSNVPAPSVQCTISPHQPSRSKPEALEPMRNKPNTRPAHLQAVGDEALLLGLQDAQELVRAPQLLHGVVLQPLDSAQHVERVQRGLPRGCWLCRRSSTSAQGCMAALHVARVQAVWGLCGRMRLLAAATQFRIRAGGQRQGRVILFCLASRESYERVYQAFGWNPSPQTRTPVDSVIWAMTSSRICRRTLGSATSSANTMALAPAMICMAGQTAELAQHDTLGTVAVLAGVPGACAARQGMSNTGPLGLE